MLTMSQFIPAVREYRDRMVGKKSGNGRRVASLLHLLCFKHYNKHQGIREKNSVSLLSPPPIMIPIMIIPHVVHTTNR